MTTTGHLPVEPIDHEAYLEFNNLPDPDRAAVRAGKWDGTTGMQVLARHRIAAAALASQEPSK